jgi:hypothetical protein
MVASLTLLIRSQFCFAVGNQRRLRVGPRLWGDNVFLNQDVCELIAVFVFVFAPLVFALIDGFLNDDRND